ncbi:MAG: hypothetical protein JSS02_20965 [Planctomycetes bacterium]|nr:hypothetical protein [Planctomycetota bacterium]
MAPTQTAVESVEFTPRDVAQPLGPVHLVLEVTRGHTRFRRRPVNSPRYLIGSGTSCNLRLGGDEIPALHSIITTNGRDITLEAIAAEPALIVNGVLVASTQLHDGDVIHLGQVELLARLEAGHSPAGVAPHADQTADTETERSLADLSAPELVDLIEAEEHEIEDFEGRQQLGLQALVQAVMARADRPMHRPLTAEEMGAPIPAPHFSARRNLAAREAQVTADSQIQADLEQLADRVGNLSDAVQGSLERSTQREAQLIAATDELLETQSKLVSQLEAVIDQVQTLKASEAPTMKPRAIA